MVKVCSLDDLLAMKRRATDPGIATISKHWKPPVRGAGRLPSNLVGWTRSVSTRFSPRRASRVPRIPGLGVGRARGLGLRGDDESAGRAARAAGRRGAALDALGPRRGALRRRHREDALRHRRRPPARGGADALPRRPALGLRLLAVGLPAHLHLLRDREDEVRPQPHRRRDPRPGAPLPPGRTDRPRRLHGDGGADDEHRQRARRLRTPARPRRHQPPHRDLDGRLGAGDRPPRRIREADRPGALPARAERRPALAADAGQRPLPAGRGARRLRPLPGQAPAQGLRRVRDARRRQRPPRARPRTRRPARPADLQDQPDPLQPDRRLRRLLAGADRDASARSSPSTASPPPSASPAAATSTPPAASSPPKPPPEPSTRPAKTGRPASFAVKLPRHGHGRLDGADRNPPAAALRQPVPCASPTTSRSRWRGRGKYPPGPRDFNWARTKQVARDPLPLLLGGYEEFGPIFSMRLLHITGRSACSARRPTTTSPSATRRTSTGASRASAT